MLSCNRESHIDSRTTSRRQILGVQPTTLSRRVKARSVGFLIFEPLPSCSEIMNRARKTRAAMPARVRTHLKFLSSRGALPRRGDPARLLQSLRNLAMTTRSRSHQTQEPPLEGRPV